MELYHDLDNYTNINLYRFTQNSSIWDVNERRQQQYQLGTSSGSYIQLLFISDELTQLKNNKTMPTGNEKCRAGNGNVDNRTNCQRNRLTLNLIILKTSTQGHSSPHTHAHARTYEHIKPMRRSLYSIRLRISYLIFLI